MPTEKEKPIEQVEELKNYLPKEKQEELAKILAYGEKIKDEGEKKKKEFWGSGRSCFSELLRYKWVYQKELEKRYRYLDKMSDIEKKKFIEEYLYDDMLYDRDGKDFFLVSSARKRREYDYGNLRNGKILIEQDVDLYFGNHDISIDEIKKISKMELKEGVGLYLNKCGFSMEGLEELVKNLKMKEGVTLSLWGNFFGDEGVKLIAENLKLKNGVTLDLNNNGIGPEGIKLIAENLKLMDGVDLLLHNNPIGNEGARYLSKMKMKEGVSFYLADTKIGDEGIIEIAKSLKLEEGVVLDLHNNEIRDKGAQALIDNLVLKNGVKLDLSHNDNISPEMGKKLKEWEKSYHDKGINCKVLV